MATVDLHSYCDVAGSASIGAGPAGAGDAGICCSGDLCVAPAAATGGGTGAGAMPTLTAIPAGRMLAAAAFAPAALCVLIQCEASAANIEGANMSAVEKEQVSIITVQYMELVQKQVLLYSYLKV